MSWRVVADLDLCRAHQLCQGEAPAVFGFDQAADRVAVLTGRPDDALRPAVKRAVAYCPALALSLIDDPIDDGIGDLTGDGITEGGEEKRSCP